MMVAANDATRSLRFYNGDGVRQLCIFLIAGLHARVHQTIKKYRIAIVSLLLQTGPYRSRFFINDR